MSGYGFAHASDEVLAVRNELAHHVIQPLQCAVTAFRDGETDTE
ncbi:hypothetical protein [Streptomyces avermitilis]